MRSAALKLSLGAIALLAASLGIKIAAGFHRQTVTQDAVLQDMRSALAAQRWNPSDLRARGREFVAGSRGRCRIVAAPVLNYSGLAGVFQQDEATYGKMTYLRGGRVIAPPSAVAERVRDQFQRQLGRAGIGVDRPALIALYRSEACRAGDLPDFSKVRFAPVSAAEQ